ncbi:MAG TPA: hypothetical protein VMH05_19015 [Bryobacteraceae bacterium]|nr:hypothetical protein [Bryobacteraceae bacterium]
MKQSIVRANIFVPLAWLFLAGALYADPVYQCGTTNTGNEDASAVTCSETHSGSGTPSFSWTADSTAGPGDVGVAATGFAQINPITGPGNFGTGASATAMIVFSDLVISGPGGTTDVLAAMNFFTHLDEVSASLDSALSGSAKIGSSASADWGVTFDDGNGNVFTSEEYSQLNLSSNAGVITNTSSTYGDFSGPTDSASLLAGTVLTTPQFSLPVGQAITVTLFAGVSAGSGWILCSVDCNGGSTGVDFTALDTFGLPLSGLVFDLPEGYTVNSVDGLIADNHFVGGTSTVPEPGTIPTLLLSFAAIWLWRFRPRFKRCSERRNVD